MSYLTTERPVKHLFFLDNDIEQAAFYNEQEKHDHV